MQGRSLLPLLRGEHPEDWRQAVYYRYFEHLDVCHNVQASYGIRTHTHKLIHYPGHGSGQAGAKDERRTPEWELFDLTRDPDELHNRYADPAYADLIEELTEQLTQLQLHYLDVPEHL
ncbi:DUF4976 domain-containing protein [Streptomyces sp. NBC_00356]